MIQKELMDRNILNVPSNLNFNDILLVLKLNKKENMFNFKDFRAFSC